MTRRGGLARVAALLLLIVGGAIGAAEVPAPGAQAPEIRLKTKDGTEVSLSSFRGKRNVLVLFLPDGTVYTARLGKRLFCEKDRMDAYGADALLVHPGPAAEKNGYYEYGETAPTVHDPDGSTYAAWGFPGAGPGKGTWACFFVDKEGKIALRWLGWQQKKDGERNPDLLDIHGEIEKKLGLWPVPATAKVARFQQGVSPPGYAGSLGAEIWPRYKGTDSMTDRETVFVRGSTGGEFALLRFLDVAGTGPGQVPPGAKILKASLRLQTVNHCSTQKTWIHRMTQAWDASVTFHRSGVKDGQDLPWKAPGLGTPGANFEKEPVTPGWQVPVNGGDVEWDVTPAVAAWVKGEPNHGFAIVAEPGHDTPDHACFALPGFNYQPGWRPQLVVWFE